MKHGNLKLWVVVHNHIQLDMFGLVDPVMGIALWTSETETIKLKKKKEEGWWWKRGKSHETSGWWRGVVVEGRSHERRGVKKL